jgi:membrane protein
MATRAGTQSPRIETPGNRREPGLTDLSRRDWTTILKRAAKESLDDGITDIAAMLAYYAFLAIPALMLVSLGLFGLLAGPDTVDSLMNKLDGVVPAEAISLLRDSLNRTIENQSGGLALLLVGLVLAVWTATGAMTGLMRGMNAVYDRKESRGFVKTREVSLVLLVCVVLAAGLVLTLLVLGPVISDAVGSAIGLEDAFGWIWWTAQWPILIVALLALFAAMFWFGPDVEHRRWRYITPGALVAVVLWLIASGGFAVYVALFGSYNKAWGSLAAVIILLTWLWISALAFLFGAEINAEVERRAREKTG